MIRRVRLTAGLGRKSIKNKQRCFTVHARAVPQPRTHLEELSRGKADVTVLCVDVHKPTQDEEAFRALLVNMKRLGRVAHDSIATVSASN